MVELAACLDAGTDYSTIQGTWCKRGEEVVKNENRPLMKLDDLAHRIGPEKVMYLLMATRLNETTTLRTIPKPIQ